MSLEHRAARAARAFCDSERVLEVHRCGGGLINDTFLVTTDRPTRWILQRINERVFPKPECIQANLRVLMNHLQAHPHDGPGLSIPMIRSTASGCDFLRDDSGDFWRGLSYIDGTRSVDVVTDESHARQIGWAVGRFHMMVSDLTPTDLRDTLPGFHVTPRYLERLDYVRAVGPDTVGMSATAWCLRFVEERRSSIDVLERALHEGQLIERVIHGDPKVNNILFALDSDRAVALIDLDTVKPGLIHYDLGDCLRSVCNRAGEEAPDAVVFDLNLCRGLLSGYFAEVGAVLTEREVQHIYDAARLLPLELGIRFLTDHLEGDVYFRVSEPGDNLNRARVQFALVESIERQEHAIRALCRELWNG